MGQPWLTIDVSLKVSLSLTKILSEAYRLTEVSFWFSRHFRQDGWSRVPGAISAAMCKECGAECAAGAVRWHGNAWNPPSVHSPSGNDVPAFRPF